MRLVEQPFWSSVPEWPQVYQDQWEAEVVKLVKAGATFPDACQRAFVAILQRDLKASPSLGDPHPGRASHYGTPTLEGVQPYRYTHHDPSYGDDPEPAWGVYDFDAHRSLGVNLTRGQTLEIVYQHCTPTEARVRMDCADRDHGHLRWAAVARADREGEWRRPTIDFDDVPF